MADEFASQFEVLATPSEDVKFDDSYRDQVMLDKLLIEDICRGQSRTFTPTTTEEISKIVQTFKNNKAHDMQGLAAEHLKFAPRVVHSSLSNLMNYIKQTGYIPQQLKQCVITAVLKKHKDPILPTNYRGATVLSIIGKVLKKVLLQRTESTLCRGQSRFQRGFTKTSSSVNAALTVSEVQNEAKSTNQNLHLIIILDACNVVWQESLLRKIYLAGVDGSLWTTLCSLYSDATSSVKWMGRLSSPFVIKQGVRSGTL